MKLPLRNNYSLRMKKKLLLYLAFHLFNSVFSQQTAPSIKIKKPVDSIYYGLYAPGFVNCYKVIEVDGIKSGEKRYKKGDLLVMQTVSASDSSFYKSINRNNPIALGDTVINWPWEPTHPYYETDGHRINFGKASLNQKTNTLTITELFYDRKKKLSKILRVQYKVIKWTFYEIILKDITNKETSRVFTFRRHIPN